MFIDTRVVCSGSDSADNLNDVESGFSVRVKPHPEGFGINKVIAVDNPVSSVPSLGLTLGDIILVEFTMPTNRPPVSTNADLDDIFELQNGTLGNNAQGSWINPSNLLIKLLDVSPPLDLVEGVTSFDLKFNPAFTSAGALINSSGTLGVENPIILSGDFSEPNPPFISAFIANDPSLDNNDLRNDMRYSKDDTFTIRFSEPVDFPFSINPGKSQIDSQFSFSHELGEDYSGVWKNRSTLVITVDEVLDDDPSLLPTLGNTTATVIGDITNRAGTSENSNSVSPPLSGTFGDYYLIMDINENGTFTQTLPTGITLGINFPNGTTLTMFKVDATTRQNIEISEFLDITITNSTTDCEMGCDVTFWIHQSELDEFGVSVGALRILHDANDDGVFERNESLVPEIEEITTNLFSVTVKLFSFSSIALGAVPGGGGGGGDETPPSFESWNYISCDPAIGCGTHIIKEIKFVTDMPTAIIPTEHSAKFILRVNENSGPNALQHVTLYTNIRGFADGIPDSDTFIRFDKGKPITVQDPHGFLTDAQVSVMPRGNNIDVIFTLLFDKPMEKSDIIIRAWDQSRNSRDARFADAIQVIPGIADEPSKFGGILGDSEPKGPIIDAEPIFSYNLFRDWAGFSDGQLSDSEFLSHLEIDGKKIPSWFKQSNISKWVMDEMLSQQEFIDALRFLSDEGLLKG